MVTTADSNLWVIRPTRRARARLRLICFPYAGGGASIFHAWSRALPNDVELCAIQMPGRETRIRERSFDRLPALVEILSDVLSDLTRTPFVLFGHSNGALIAFELARHLRNKDGISPAALIVSARRAPSLPADRSAIHALPEAEFINELRRIGGTSDAVLENQELMEMVIPPLRADFAIHETYTYVHGVPLGCPVVAFGGEGDPDVPEKDLLRWRSETTGPFRAQVFPGGHFFLHNNRALLLQAVGDVLADALPN